MIETQVGKVKIGHTTGGFTVIIHYFKLQKLEFIQLIDDMTIDF